MEGLNQEWRNFLTRGPKRILIFDRKVGPEADLRRVLVIHLLRERNNTKHALNVIENYFKTLNLGFFVPKLVLFSF